MLTWAGVMPQAAQRTGDIPTRHTVVIKKKNMHPCLHQPFLYSMGIDFIKGAITVPTNNIKR
jgi:hypothetical protein